MPESVSNASYFPNNFYFGGPSWTLFEIYFFLLVSLLAMAANVLSLWILCRKSFKLKLNVRLLLISCSFCYSLRCFHYIMIGAYYFRLYYLGPLKMWDIWCSLAMYPYVVADNGVYLYAFMISLDRAWSTYLVGPKLTNHNLSSITIRTITLCVLPLLALTLFFYSGLSHDRPSFLSHCAIVQIMKPDFVLAGNIFILTTQCLTCLIYSILQIINAKKYANLLINTALYSLRLRARYSTNLNVTQWLMPISVFHCAYSFVIFATYNAIRLGRPDYFQGATLIIQRTIFTALAVESFTHPVMLIW
uniref:G-protein coupled receptors family 1 profile domain-containing protein n=1 Tax=Romanomermis culicivorax TaxID=13658 RepID=A0A915HDY8_ROMCU